MGIRCQITLCKIKLLTICESQGKIPGRILYTPSLKLASSPRLRSMRTFIRAFFGEVSHSTLLSFGIMRIKGSCRPILDRYCRPIYRSIYRSIYGQHVGRLSIDISANTRLTLHYRWLHPCYIRPILYRHQLVSQT